MKQAKAKKSQRVTPQDSWRSSNISELAREQGVKPVQDPQSFGGGFPEDEDFEAFMNAVRAARQTK